MESYKDIENIHSFGKKLLNTSELSSILKVSKGRNLENLTQKLVSSGVLTQIEKGKYFTTNNPPLEFEIANYIYTPSYISLETALNYFGILSQFPHEITCISTKKAVQKNIKGKSFSYSKIKKELFTGYQKIDSFLIATPSKAFFDYLYFITKSLRTENYISEMDLSKVSKSEVLSYFKLLKTGKVNNLLELINKYL